MKMKLLMICAAALASLTAQASVAIMDVKTFKCSDGEDYNVVRHYWGGYGPGNWNLAAFCTPGILNEEYYGGRVMNARESHPDIARCQDQDTPAVRACFDEFASLNGKRGVSLTPILHGRRDSKPGTTNSEQPVRLQEQPLRGTYR